MTWHQDLNREWLQRAKEGKPAWNGAKDYGVTIQQLPQDVYNSLRVLGTHHLTGEQNRGKHNLYCEVLNIRGNRIFGATLQMSSNYGHQLPAKIEKPDNEPGTNFPLFNYGGVSVKVLSLPGVSNVPSETVSGIHYMHPDEDQWNTLGHHSFYVAFQLMESMPKPQPPITPPTQPQPTEGLTWFDENYAMDSKYLYTRVLLSDIDNARQAMRFIRSPRMVG